MSSVVPFRRRSVTPEPDPQPVRVDVDGDGIPDTVTPGRDVAPLHRAPDPVPVQPPVYATAAPREADLRPVVPAWLRTPEGRRKTVRWWVRLQSHRAKFHAVRGPLYLGRAVARTPRGVARTVGRLTVWGLDLRADPMEQELASAGRAGVGDYLKLREDRAARVRARLVVLVVCLAAGIPALIAAWVYAGRVPAYGPGLRALLVVLAVGVLAKLGTDPERPLIGQVMVASARYRELTPAVLLRALKAAGLGGSAAKVDKAGQVVEEDTRPTLPQPIQRAENGAGWLAMVDLPYGKTVADAAGAVEQLASGLDVDDTQVFVEKVPGSQRRVLLYVPDEDPFLLPPRHSPLAKAPAVSVWDAHPLGVEPRGREVRPSLLFNSFLIGAIPRSGKTFAARALVAPGLLDPHCDVSVLDFKGGKDWLGAKPLCVTFQSGDDEDDLEYAIAVLARLKSEMQVRFKAFQGMDDVENPEGKLTQELAQAGYRSHLLILDEVQNLLRASDKRVQKAALALLIWLAKTAPAAGLTLVMATQRPATDVIPADLRDNTSVRIALRTKTWQSSDAILGQGINAAGFGTHRFLEDHKGAAIIGGVSNGRGGDLARIRTDLLTIPDFSRICQVGLQRRQDAGTLRGQAAGAADDVRITVTVVEDVLSVWPAEETKVRGAEILDRLGKLRPELYARLDQAALTSALKAAGVPVVQVFRDGSNGNGYALAAVQKAARKELED